MKKTLIVITLLITLSINACTSYRDYPDEEELNEYGVTEIVAYNSLGISQAKRLLDDYGIENSYPSSDESALVLFLCKNENTNKYYEIYHPEKREYDVIVREVLFPDFSIIEDQITNYVNGEISIALCDDYCGLLNPNHFRKGNHINDEVLDELDSIFLVIVGELEASDIDSSSIVLGRFSNYEYVVFYFDHSTSEIVVLFEFELDSL